MKKIKGISPLIATIMLIAFTMIVAGILAGWATRFVTTQVGTLQSCSNAQILIQNGYYNASGHTLYLTVYNVGKVPLTGFTLIMTYNNGTVVPDTTYQATNLSSQAISTFNTSASDNLQEATIQSRECRGAQDFLTKYEIEGLV